MIKYLFKRYWRLQNLVVDEINDNISEIVVDLCRIIICCSRKWEFYYDICSRLNELMKLKKWTKESDDVPEIIRYRFVNRTENDYKQYFDTASDSLGIRCQLSDSSCKEVFNSIVDIYNSIVSRYYIDLSSKKVGYIYPDDLDEFLEKLFEKYFPNFD